MTTELLNTDSEAFAKRLANLLREHRRDSGHSISQLARSSSGRFSRTTLRQVEAGGSVLGATDLNAIAELYAVDLSTILPTRVALEVEPNGVLRTAGVTAVFDPADENSLLTAYLRLVRRLRDAERAPSVDLRRIDIEILAAALDQPGEVVVDRLGVLMGATRKQRGALVGSFAAGAAIIGLGGIMIMTTGGSPEATSSEIAGSTPPAEIAMVDDEVRFGDDSLSSETDVDGEASPILDPVMQEDIDEPFSDDGIPNDAPSADGADPATVDSGPAGQSDTAETPDDEADVDTGSTRVDGAGDLAPVGIDLPDDDPESDGSSDESPSGTTSAADGPAVPVTPPPPSAAEPEQDPILERDPVMTPMPTPDPIVGREPVMTPMPMPDPVSRGPVMMPMPAPEVEAPTTEVIDDNIVVVDAPTSREVSA